MERLYTQAQWRAIADVEECTGFNEWHIRSDEHASKPLLGGVWSGGEFRLAWVAGHMRAKTFGPPRCEFFVYEASSAWVFTFLGDMATVLSGARERITDMGPEHLADLIAAGRRHVAERKERAIEEANRPPPKARKASKRSQAVFAGSDGKCHYCSTALTLDGKWHIEHKMPRALKGGNEMHNLAASCVPCNMRKRDKTDLEFQALLEAERAVQAAQSGVVGADPSGFGLLDLHGLKHAQPSHSTPLN